MNIQTWFIQKTTKQEIDQHQTSDYFFFVYFSELLTDKTERAGC